MVETYQCALLSARRDMTQHGRNQIHDKETHLPLNLDQGCLIVGHLLKTLNQATEAVCEVVRAGGLDTPATHSLSASIALRLSTSATSAPASVRRAECSDAASSSQPESPSEPSEPLQQVDLATWEKLKQTRLTYNCAHLRSTKESLTIFFVKIIWLKKFLSEFFFLSDNFFE